MLNNLSDNQKRTLALAAMALLALACLCGTLAFTVDMVPANNVLSFGSVRTPERSLSTSALVCA